MKLFAIIATLFLIWQVVWEIRDTRKKEFLAKLMDCTYVKFSHGGEYYISNK
jgi:hypothetical protein